MGFLERSKSFRTKDASAERSKEDVVGPTRKIHSEKRALREFSKEENGWKASSARDGPSRRDAGTGSANNSKLSQVTKQTKNVENTNNAWRLQTPSPDYTPNHSVAFNVRNSQIGVALGSPAHPPTWGRSYTTGHVSTSLSTSREAATFVEQQRDNTVATVSQVRPALKKAKSSTFKSFFQRKPSKQAISEPFYKVQQPQVTPAAAPEPPAKEAGSVVSRKPSETENEKKRHAHERTVSRGLIRQNMRADMDAAHFGAGKRSVTSPAVQTLVITIPIPVSQSPRLVSDGESFDSLAQVDSNNKDSKVEIGVARQLPLTPRLEVDIPSVEMERYSVMFEQLLMPPQQTILERRKARKELRFAAETLGSLTPTDEGMPQRRATSPSLPRSPLMNRDDSRTPTATKARAVSVLHRPRAPKRAHTDPVHNTTTARAGFSTALSTQASSPVWSEASLPPTPASEDAQTFVSLEDDSMILSPSSYPTANAPLMSKLEEPAWEMLTQKKEKKKKKEPFSRKHGGEATLSKTHKVSSLNVSPIPKAMSPVEYDSRVVQISVARSVSVSKARQRVKEPITSKQPLKPRVVQMKNRKSTVVLLENA